MHATEDVAKQTLPPEKDPTNAEFYLGANPPGRRPTDDEKRDHLLRLQELQWRLDQGAQNGRDVEEFRRKLSQVKQDQFKFENDVAALAAEAANAASHLADLGITNTQDWTGVIKRIPTTGGDDKGDDDAKASVAFELNFRADGVSYIFSVNGRNITNVSAAPWRIITVHPGGSFVEGSVATIKVPVAAAGEALRSRTSSTSPAIDTRYRVPF